MGYPDNIFNWKLMNGFTQIGEFYANENGEPTLRLTIKPVNLEDRPLALFGLDINRTEITYREFWNYVKNHIIPRNRVGIDKILKSMGLERYDVWGIFIATRGWIAGQGYFWYKMIDEDKFEYTLPYEIYKDNYKDFNKHGE